MPMPVVTVVAGIVAEPELAFAQSGKAWVRIRCIAKDRVKDSNGQWTDGDPWFFTTVAFGDIAEHVSDSATRGDTLIVVGRMQNHRWTRQDGSEAEDLRIVADEIGLSLRWKTYKEDGAPSLSPPPSRQAAPAQQVPAHAGQAEEPPF